MRQAETPSLLRWLYRLDIDGVVNVRATLQRGAEIALRKTTIAAEAYAHANTDSFLNRIVTSQDEDARRGISRVITIVDRTSHLIRCYGELTGHSARRNARLRQRPAFLRMIDSLTTREYEALGCLAMRFAGASEVAVTRSGTEGGIDFFALISAPGRCHLFAGGNNALRIIGQSKKYVRPVSADKVKEFITTMDEVKFGGEPKTERIIPAWFRSAKGPIVGCIVGHNGFQSGAVSRARKHGIIIADSLDMAELIALSRGIPEHFQPAERLVYCKGELNGFLPTAERSQSARFYT